MSRQFVLEAGAGQAFVFAGDKQAVGVGASELILCAGSGWMRESTRNAEEPVVVAAGKAVPGEEGRAIHRAAASRALREAPGLEVWL